MRTPTVARTIRLNAHRAVLLAALVSGASGCSLLRATVKSYDVGRNGIAMPQQQLREALARADFPAALAFREDDALLRALNVGVSSYYASQFARSAAVLDSAALLADDRVTESVSQGALSLVTNDLAMSYQPRRTERLFIPYYAMLSFARLEQWEDAAVEARRVSALLAEYSRDRADGERSTHAVLHSVAGTVFERAGDAQAAQVAYRTARSLVARAAPISASAGGDGEILVIVERGFVAHRATESINVCFEDADRDSLRDGDHHATSRVASRIVDRMSRSDWDPRARGARRGHDRDDENGYWLSVALPSLRRSQAPLADVMLVVDGADVGSPRLSGMIDEAALADQGRERVALLSRAVVRAAAKYAISKAVKDRKGEVAGKIANIGASLLERADVRSWHLLPQEVTLLRVRVPAGVHHLQVASGGDVVDVGTVNVRAGMVALGTARLWGHGPKVIASR